MCRRFHIPKCHPCELQMQSSWLVLLRQSQPSSSLFHRGPIEAQYLLASHWEPRAHAPATAQPSHPIKCAFARSTNTTITRHSVQWLSTAPASESSCCRIKQGVGVSLVNPRARRCGSQSRRSRVATNLGGHPSVTQGWTSSSHGPPSSRVAFP